EVDAEAGMALLPAGLPVVPVVDTEDREIGRIDHGDGGERADIHEELAVAGDDEDALVGPRQREAKPHHGGRAHRAGERIDVGGVAGHRADVAGGAAQSGDEQKILVAADQRGHRFAALEHEARRGRGCHPSRHAAFLPTHPRVLQLPQNGFAPISLCVSSTATALPLLKAMVSAAPTVAATSSVRSTRRPMTSIASSTRCVAWPMGNCQGFPSPKSPRMLTSVRNGKRPPLIRESMLMQLPTPLDCISSTARAPPRSAPAISATPSSSVVSGIECTSGSPSERSMRMLWPASGT